MNAFLIKHETEINKKKTVWKKHSKLHINNIRGDSIGLINDQVIYSDLGQQRNAKCN